MRPIQIGLRVRLRAAPQNRGLVVDHVMDDDLRATPFPNLVEWNDHTISRHKSYELETAGSTCPPRLHRKRTRRALAQAVVPKPVT
jgi:hypothetical protein